MGGFRRVLNVFRRKHLNEEFEDELRFHREMSETRGRERGLSVEEAQAETKRRLGNLSATKEGMRDARVARWLDSCIQDIRHAAAISKKHWNVAAVVIVTLALGIGATASIFTLLEAVVIRPLPYRQPEKLAMIWELTPTHNVFPVSAQNLMDWRSESHTFESMAAWISSYTNVAGTDSPERIRTSSVSWNLFHVLGVHPAVGREFLPSEDERSTHRVAILSDTLWRRVYHANASILGNTVRIDGQDYTAIGIMPPDFGFPQNTDLWVPLSFGTDADPNNRGLRSYYVVGRVRETASLKEAQTELDVVAQHLSAAYPSDERWAIKVVSLHKDLVGDTATILATLLTAAILILVIGCANVANLLLAHAGTRRTEMLIRSAIGASKLRVARQMLTEVVFLAVIAGLLGILISLVMVPVFFHLIPDLPAVVNLPGIEKVGVDYEVLGFTALISLGVAILIGVAPALSISRSSLREIVTGVRGHTYSRGMRACRQALAVVQITVAVGLLVGMGLLLKSFLYLQREDLGFDADNVFTLDVALRVASNNDKALRDRTWHRLLDSVRSQPDLQSASLISTLPLEDRQRGFVNFIIAGAPAPPTEYDKPSAYERPVTENYFDLMHIRLVSGRKFTENDNQSRAQAVGIVDLTTVQKYFEATNPVGQQIYISRGRDREAILVIGVVAGIKLHRLASHREPIIYRPFFQANGTDAALLVRSPARDPVISELRTAMGAVDPELPTDGLRSMRDFAANTAWRPRFTLILISSFSILALGLAAIGIYGLFTYEIKQRSVEIAIRKAVGATPRQIFGMIVKQICSLLACGAIGGLFFAIVFSSWWQTMVYGVSVHDPFPYLAATALVIAIVLLTTCGAALRAATSDYLALRR